MSAARVERYGPWLATAAVALSFILFALAGLYTVVQQNYVDERLCESAVENREAVRSTWNAARELILPTAQDKEAINKFFDGVLRPIPALECVNNQPVPKEEP